MKQFPENNATSLTTYIDNVQMLRILKLRKAMGKKDFDFNSTQPMHGLPECMHNPVHCALGCTVYKDFWISNHLLSEGVRYVKMNVFPANFRPKISLSFQKICRMNFFFPSLDWVEGLRKSVSDSHWTRRAMLHVHSFTFKACRSLSSILTQKYLKKPM